jgi:prophage antirepressor-like protein
MNEEDEPWFHVKEVCKFLDIKQPSVAIKPLDEDEKVLTGLSVKADDIEAANALEATLQEIGVNSNRVRVSHPIRRRGHPAWFVNMCGLATLIQRSNAAVTPGTDAHRFRKWLNSEVVPSIIKYGQYIPSSDSNAARRALQDLRAKNLEEAFEQLPTHELNSIIRDQASKSPQFKASFSEHLKKIEPIDDRKVMRTLGIMNPDVFMQRLVDSGIKTEGGTLTDLGKQFCVAANISEKWDPSLIDHIRFCA